MKHIILTRSRLRNLEAQLDTHLFGVYRGEDGKFYRDDGSEAGAGDFKTVAGAAKATAAVGAGVGAVAGGKALAKRYGADQMTSPGKAVSAVARGVGRDISGGVSAVGRKSLTPAANVLSNVAARTNRVAAVAADSGRKSRGLRKTLGLLGKAATARVGFDAVKTRLVELSAKADAVLGNA